MLLYEKHAGARATSLKELTKLSRHGLKIGRDKNAILLGSEGQNRGIGHTIQVCPIRRKKIHGGFPAQTAPYNRIPEAGIRQESNHSSALPRRQLTPHVLELLP